LEYEGRLIGTGTLMGDVIQGVFVHPSHHARALADKSCEN